MQMYYKSCVDSRTINVHELLCCTNGYAMRIKRLKFWPFLAISVPY